MLSLTTRQQALIDGEYKIADWLVVVTDKNSNRYYWSNRNVLNTEEHGDFIKWDDGIEWDTDIKWDCGGDNIDASNAFEFKIIDWPGITLRRGGAESGILAPNDLDFTITNKDSALTADDFIGGTVWVHLSIGDNDGAEIFHRWRFRVKKATPIHQKIKFFCEDFIQEYLRADYPNTKLVDNIFPSDDQIDKDNLCVPIPFGVAYVPLRSVYITDQRYYLLGLASFTYTISAVHSPSDFPESEWLSSDYTFTQATKADGDAVDWRVFQPIIADSDSDGVADASGLFLSGDIFLDILTKFSRSDTVNITNPAYVIKFVLEDLGIAADDINAASLATAAAIYDSWGLSFNGALFYQQPAKDVITNLLNMCNSILISGEQIELHVLSADSVKTITSVLKPQDVSEAIFSYTDVSDETDYDSAYAAFQESNKPQDKLITIPVPVKSSYDYPSGEIFEVYFIQDSQNVQNATCLKLQREYLKKANIDFDSKGHLLALLPDDVITINDANYGGTYPVLVEEIHINKDLQLSFTCIRFKETLDNWDDLAFSSVTIAADDSTDYWTPVIAGPDSPLTGVEIPNQLRGRLRIGETSNYILLDPAGPIIELVGGASGITIDATNDRIRSGNYVAGIRGAGFTLEPDLLEVGNIASRGIIRTTVFQKDVISCIGGSLFLRPADVLSTDMSALDAATLTIEGNETFAVGDFLRIKDGTEDEWFEVTNIGSAPTYTVTRDTAGDYGADANPTWKKGASVINYGASGKGGVYLTSSESNAPYLAMFTHAGAPWATITTHTRLGNLNGSYGYGAEVYGMGIGQYGVASKNWITVEQTNGIRLGTNTTVFGQWDLSGNVFIGDQANEHIKLSTSGLQIYDGAALYATYGATTTIGLTASEHISISATATQLKDGATVLTEISGGNVLVGQTGAGQSNVYITSGAISLRNNVTDIITLSSAGVVGITVAAGGDINLTPSDSDPALIKWSTSWNLGAAATASRGLCIWPSTINTGYFKVGFDPVGNAAKPFEYIKLEAQKTVYIDTTTSIILDVTTDANNYATMGVVDAVSYHEIYMTTREAGGSAGRVGLRNSGGTTIFFGPTVDNLIDLGRDSYRFADAYVKNLYVGAGGSGYGLGSSGAGESLLKFYPTYSLFSPGYLACTWGIHVGGISDPGTDNLIVDGTALVSGGSLTLTKAAAYSSFYLQNLDATPNDSDNVGIIWFSAKNSINALVNYAYITAEMMDVTNGTEDGYLRFNMFSAGVTNIAFTFDGDGTAWADVEWSVTSPDIGIKNPTADDYLDWALEHAEKPIKPYKGFWSNKNEPNMAEVRIAAAKEGILSRKDEKNKYGKGLGRISIGTARWAKSAREDISFLKSEIVRLEEEVQLLKAA